MNQRIGNHALGLAALVLGLSSPDLHAQWTSQTLHLEPGWNAVFLEVQPEPRDCDTVLAGLPIESVWRWNRRFESVQFIDDPGVLVPPPKDWLVYLRSGHPLSDQANLHTLDGGRPYLIRLRADAPPIDWVVRGKALVARPDWISDSLNFVGFDLPDGGSPSFEAFFGTASALVSGPVYRLDPNGHWGEVPVTVPMRSGEGFWIRSQGTTDFRGPLRVTVEQGASVDFGRALQEQVLRITNDSTEPALVTVNAIPSEPAPSEPAVAGPVPLSYWLSDVAGGRYEWTPVVGPIHRDLGAGETWALRLAVRRTDMALLPVGESAAVYQTILEVTESQGLHRCRVPVTAQGLSHAGSNPSGIVPFADGDPPTALRPGLWVGSVVLNGVSQPTGGDPQEILPTGSEFQFRLLLHMDDQGEVKLLQRVLQMWKEGTYKPSPEDPTRQVVDVPGRFVLLTDESSISDYTGAALRDGASVGRRFSSAAFGFRDPIPVVDEGAGRWACVVPLDYDDPLNPFKHVHHPDHDNLDALFEQRLPAGRESFTVTRRIELEFTADDPDGLSIPGWGDNQVGGIYRETFEGLTTGPQNEPVFVQGTFRLNLASSIGALNEEE